MFRSPPRLVSACLTGLAGLAAAAACSTTTGVTVCANDPAALDIASGDLQHGVPGAALAPFTVVASDSAGRPFAGAVILFKITAGPGRLSADSAITDFSGRASSRYVPAVSSPLDTQRVEAQVRSRCGGTGPSAVFRAILRATTHPAGAVAANLPVSLRPFGIAVNNAGLVYATRLDAAAVTTGNTDSLTVGPTIAVGYAPTAVAFEPYGATAYVANQYSGAIGVVDVASGSQVRQVPITGDPFNVTVSPGGTVYATANTGWAFAIDPVTLMVTDSLWLGGAPSSMVFGSGDTLLYVSDFTAGTVVEIWLRSRLSTKRTFPVGGAPQGLAISPDRTTLYIANEAGSLMTLAIASGAVTRTTSLAAGGFGLALAPDGTQLYVSLPAAGSVVVVDRASGAILSTIATGGQPRRVAFSADGATAAVANEAGSVVFIR